MLKIPSACRTPGLLLLGALSLAPGAAPALSLGEPRVESQYGQPLRVRMPVELTSEEEQSDAGLLRARLLGLEHYESESAALPEIPLDELEIATEQYAGQRWVVVRSRRSVREPIMTLFVNVRLGPSQLTREVPVLLDFPTPRRAPPPAAATVAAAVPAAAAASPAPAPEAAAVPPDAAVAPALAAGLPAIAAESPPAPPQRRRRSAAAGASAGWPERPAGYSRLRFEERLASLERLGPLPPPAVSTAPADVPPAAAPVAGGDLAAAPPPPPAAGGVVAAAEPEAVADGGGWPWGRLLLVLAALALAALWWRRRGVDIPVATASQPPEPAPPAAVAPVPVAAAFEPEAALPMAATLPAVMPAGERSLDLADPPDFALDAEPEAAPAGPARDRYPNQALRERVTQLARLVATPSERRKLELVKAYIDVERLDSAEKLLAELEQHYPVYGRPDAVDFELV